MIVTKVGDSLSVALPEDEVARLGLKEGDEVEVEVKRAEPQVSAVVSKLSPEEWLVEMRKLRGRIPADFKFDREEANAR
jgi:antitoxin MazE